jgi:hypothetical protein
VKVHWPQVWALLGLCVATVGVIAMFFYSIPAS